MNIGPSHTVHKQKLNLFPKSIQKKINWFAFFLAFPFLSILGNSITFFIFLLLVVDVGRFWKKNFQGKRLLLLFIFIGLVSTVSSPVNLEFENLNWLLIFIQYVYWIYMTMFFIIYFEKINFFQLSKWIFYGSLLYSIAFYLIPFDVNNPIVSFEFNPGRNSYVFNMLACIPISIYYVKMKWGNRKTYIVLILFLLLLLISNGRSGVIIIFMQLFFITAIIRPSFQRASKYYVFILLSLFIVSQLSKTEIYLNSLSNQIEGVSPRIASLLRSEGEGDLTQDKSWLTRKLMIEKGKEIVIEHPFIGVGPNNFKNYNTELNSYNLKQYKRLHSISKKTFSQQTSAHNTYLQAITEFGVTGLLVYILFILTPLIFTFKKYLRNSLKLEDLVLISLIGIVIHFYVIANLSGALPWFVFGLSWGLVNKNWRNRKNIKKNIR